MGELVSRAFEDVRVFHARGCRGRVGGGVRSSAATLSTRVCLGVFPNPT